MKASAESKDTGKVCEPGAGTALYRRTKIDLACVNHYIRWTGYPSPLFQVPCSRLRGDAPKIWGRVSILQTEPLPQTQDLLRILTVPEIGSRFDSVKGCPAASFHYLTYATYSKGVRNVRLSALSQAIARDRSTCMPGLRGVFGSAEQGSQARVCGSRHPRSPCPRSCGGQPYRRRGSDATAAPRYTAKGHRNHCDHGSNPREQQESLG